MVKYMFRMLKSLYNCKCGLANLRFAGPLFASSKGMETSTIILLIVAILVIVAGIVYGVLASGFMTENVGFLNVIAKQ